MSRDGQNSTTTGNWSLVRLVEKCGVESITDRVIVDLLLLKPLRVLFEDIEIFRIRVFYDES